MPNPKETELMPEESLGMEQIMKQQSLEQQVEMLKERVATLRRDNLQFKRQSEKQEKDTHEFVAYFQKEVSEKDTKVSMLKDQLFKAETTAHQELSRTKDMYEKQINELNSTLNSTQSRLEKKVASLQEELKVVFEFKQQKTLITGELEASKAELVRLKKQHQEQNVVMERKFFEEKAKIQRNFENRIEQIKGESRNEAQLGLDAETRKIIAENKRMGEELRFQQQATDELQKEIKMLSDENKRLQREISSSQEQDKEYAKQGVLRSRELKDSYAKVKNLERTISQIVREFEVEKEKWKFDYVKERDETKIEIDGMKQLVRLKNRELKNLRRLAQVVLDQRTEVETYFIEALEQVKSEIRKDKAEQQKASMENYRKQMRDAHHDVNVKFPSIRSANENVSAVLSEDPSVDSLQPVGANLQDAVAKVDLRELSWKDRERVLRLLFAKINSVQDSYAGTVQRKPMTGAGKRAISRLSSDDLTAPSDRLGTSTSYQDLLNSLEASENMSAARHLESQEKIAAEAVINVEYAHPYPLPPSK